ncbi:3 exoribonuclease family protein [Ophiostoma piceae UAMH 11346]|uniref:3 exoribonuclease family protein n=1 Tax=Ophiostoma piceae (strain UAMH 11346) TaxID=1262450 RepID=S3CZ86_OPHP1|nr:3 exoribonuclease family protein [Ophiostoma piceae UAMH 11346]
MTAGKGKKRALSYDSEETEAKTSAVQAGKAGGSRKTNDDDDWSAWQEGVRTQEAVRVQQYVQTFERDIVEKAHDSALADLRRRENTHAQREKKLHDRILEECKLDGTDGEQQNPLYAAGCQVLGLLESTLEQYHHTEAGLRTLGSESGQGSNFEGLRTSWDNDLAEAHKLLSYGRAYGDGLVKDIIVPTGPGSAAKTLSSTSIQGDSGINQTGKAALGMFPRSSSTVASRDTWGEAAQSQMEVLSRLMKTMAGGHEGGEGSVQVPEKKSVRFDI